MLENNYSLLHHEIDMLSNLLLDVLLSLSYNHLMKEEVGFKGPFFNYLA